MSNIITEYLSELSQNGLPYKAISAILLKTEGIFLSPNAIGKRLKLAKCPSKRGPTLNSRLEVKTAIENLIRDLPSTVGYRNMTDILRQKGFHVRRDTVMELMREVNPTGTALRRSRKLRRRVYRSNGPNHTWHIDGYDKFKPFGFPIHGCIDGYSRKILWLNVGPSNNDPSITAYYFASCIAENKGCPRVLQSDPGTENTISGAIQCTLRNGGTDYFSGENSYRITFSKLNQRIEAWWSILRRQESEWWIDLFKDLEQFGAFMRENQHDKRCIRFCFMPVLQKVLDDLKDRWNNHHIAYSRYAACPNGRPVVLYSVPELNGGNDCIQKLEDDDLNFAFQQCTLPSTSGSSQFDQAATIEFNRIGFSKAQHWQEALQQYFYLREHFQFQEI